MAYDQAVFMMLREKFSEEDGVAHRAYLVEARCTAGSRKKRGAPSESFTNASRLTLDLCSRTATPSCQDINTFCECLP